MAIRRNLNNTVFEKAFIEGSDKPILPVSQPDSAASRAVSSAATPSTMLIRFNDPAIPALLAAIAEADDRSKHHVALKAIGLGLEQLRKEFNL